MIVKCFIIYRQKFNSDAQSRIASLTEELRQFKESAVPVPKASVKGDDDRHNSSLTGMCMADELRDVFMNQECSFASRSINRTRKRPSSILSVALAKMDQSACMLDFTEHEIEPRKKTRLSIQSDVSEELDISEVKEIREYLVELQVYNCFRLLHITFADPFRIHCSLCWYVTKKITKFSVKKKNN